MHFLFDSGPIVAFSFVFSELDQVDDLASQGHSTSRYHKIKIQYIGKDGKMLEKRQKYKKGKRKIWARQQLTENHLKMHTHTKTHGKVQTCM